MSILAHYRDFFNRYFAPFRDFCLPYFAPFRDFLMFLKKFFCAIVYMEAIKKKGGEIENEQK